MTIENYAIEALALSKRFGEVQANDAVSLEVKKGSVHGIVGENGAGKSTLLKMLFGFYHPDDGELKVDGKTVKFASPADAMAVGVGMVHQHFMLVEPFTVLENIMLGAEGSSKISEASKKARAHLLELEEIYGFDLPLDIPVSELSVGVRQRAEILKALYRGADILILDEPTAVLTPQETVQLFALVRQLTSQGKTVIFVTHKLGEIMEITDRVTVIRAGRVVGEVATVDTNAEQLAEMMVGARIVRQVERVGQGTPQTVLKIENANLKRGHGRGLKDINLEVHAGQVLGIAGVAGNGQTELMQIVTGLEPVDDGTVVFKDTLINGAGVFVDPVHLREMGLAHVAEDRLRTGAVEDMTAQENAILGYQHNSKFVKNGVLRTKNIANAAAEYFESQDVRPRAPGLQFGSFSGGNQQKLVIAREIAHGPDLLVIGQPTRGVDIGAVTLIYDQITELRNQGKAILLISADLDELFQIADDIAVMCEGEIVGQMPTGDADEQTIGLMMAGKKVGAAR